MKKILLSIMVAFGLSGIGYAGSISINGPTEVCPGIEYLFIVNPSFTFGECDLYWSLSNSSGLILLDGESGSFRYTFSNPVDDVYTIYAFATGGIFCMSVVNEFKQVTTTYPKPTITGPADLCEGETGVFNATVNASQDCFNHNIDWQIPIGWTGTTNSSGSQLTLTAGTSLSGGNYNVSARTWYPNRNEYGQFQNRLVYAGPPDLIVPQIFGPYSLAKNSTGTWTAHISGRNTECYPASAYTYKWYYKTPATGYILSGETSPTYTKNIGSLAYLQLKLVVSLGSVSNVYYTTVTCSNCGGGGLPIKIPDLPRNGEPTEDIVDLESNDDKDSQEIAFDFNTTESIASPNLKDKLQLSQVNIYPNPSSQILTVEYNADEFASEDALIQLLDIDGKIVIRTKSNTPSIELDISDLQNGIYFLKILSDSQSVTKKVLIHN